MELQSKHRGFGVAVLASVLLLTDTLLLIITALTVWNLSGLEVSQLRELWRNSPLPFVVYLIWFLGVAGSISAIASIVMYGFRERWFWWCLLIASLAWLAFPPIHALIGLLATILLIRCHKFFPRHQSPLAPAP